MDDLLDSLAVRLILGWHLISLVLALTISDGRSLFLALACWTAVAVVVWQLRPGPYLPVVLVLAAIEEAIVYSFGGGLQGQATSLLQDYVHALPVFAMLGVSWWLSLRRWRIPVGGLAVVAGLHGVFLELLLPGHVMNPATVVLLGGPTVFIYASIACLPRLPEGGRPFTVRAGLVTFLGGVIAMVGAGVVADTLARAIGV